MYRNHLITSLFALGIASVPVPAPAAIINVPADIATIQGAINAAVNGDEIIVAPGTYPETINLGSKAINLHSASGNPGDTIIQGTGGGVVGTSNAGAGTILEGFTVTGGSGVLRGGGMNNFSGSPTVTNCIFSGNIAFAQGGGMYNDNSSPTLTGCTFSGNTASTGGGIHNDGALSIPTVINCSFSGNTATAGGGIFNNNNSPIVTGCTFSGNTATGSSGGGGMYNSTGSPIITDCTFSNNSATGPGSGAGMFNFGSSPAVAGSTFSGNMATVSGGGMYSTNLSNPAVTGSSFSGNMATVSGGGMYSTNSGSLAVTGSTFSGNIATGSGGGMYSIGDTPTLTGCSFLGNTTDGPGGGLYLESGINPRVTNCIFSGNIALNNGGGIFNQTSSPLIINCSFSGNVATGLGGALNNEGASTPSVTNCIFWGDTPDEINNTTSTPTISYNIVQGGLGAGSLDGGGNLDLDPLFVDALGPDALPGTADDDLHLQPGAPGIDAGDNLTPGLSSITTDRDGSPRFIDDIGVANTGNQGQPGAWVVDMGAFERQIPSGQPSCVADITPPGGNGTVNIDDLVALLNAFGPCP